MTNRTMSEAGRQRGLGELIATAWLAARRGRGQVWSPSSPGAVAGAGIPSAAGSGQYLKMSEVGWE